MDRRERPIAARILAACRPRSGFTLVELLVVIGVIAVLIAILLPSLSRAHLRARMVACQSNMRQILMAHAMYRMDFSDAKPPFYVKKILSTQTDGVSPDVKWSGKVVGNGILVDRGMLPIEALMCPTSEMAEDVQRDLENWKNNALVRSGSSYVYFYRWGDPNLTPANFAIGVTYQRAHNLGRRALLMDICAEPGHNYAGEYAGRRWVAHERLNRVNVGFDDSSVHEFPADELMLRFPAGAFEEQQWFLEADKRY